MGIWSERKKNYQLKHNKEFYGIYWKRIAISISDLFTMKWLPWGNQYAWYTCNHQYWSSINPDRCLTQNVLLQNIPLYNQRNLRSFQRISMTKPSLSTNSEYLSSSYRTWASLSAKVPLIYSDARRELSIKARIAWFCLVLHLNLKLCFVGLRVCCSCNYVGS